MKAVNLIGVDPGIVDTAAVWIRIDTENKIFEVEEKVWREVTTRGPKGTITVDERFLNKLRKFCRGQQHVFIENYRNRGRNPNQDQKMSMLVQVIHSTLSGSKLVDNTGVKNVVLEDTLELLGLHVATQKTHHNDIKSAKRIALKGAYQDPALNKLVADLVRDRLEGVPWTLMR
jgi:hypothetical protein